MPLKILQNNIRYNKNQVLEKIREIKNILIKEGIKYSSLPLEEIEEYIERTETVDENAFRLIKMNCDIRAMGDIYIPNIKCGDWWGMLMELVEISGIVCYGRIICNLTMLVSDQIIKEKIGVNQISVSYMTSKTIMDIYDVYKKTERFNDSTFWAINEKKLYLKMVIYDFWLRI